MKLSPRLATASYLAVFPALALSQEKVTSGLKSAATWGAGLVALACCLALMYAAIKKMFGDPQANEHISGVVIGAVIGLGASGIVGLLSSWFMS